MEIKETAQGVVFKVKAVPNSGKNGIAGVYNGMLKVKVAAAPERGRANEELTEFLSGVLKVSKSRVKVIKGMTAREKTISISGLNSRAILKLTEE